MSCDSAKSQYLNPVRAETQYGWSSKNGSKFADFPDKRSLSVET